MEPFAFAFAESATSADPGESSTPRHPRIQAQGDSEEDDDRMTARQLRVVVEAEDFDAALSFYRDSLGLVEEEAFTGEGDARVVILRAGRATLELANPAQVAMIDDVEVGRRVAPHIRLAFEVDDTEAVTHKLVADGADLVAKPVETPWRSLNSRLEGPAGIQLTIFEELDKR